MKKKIKIDTNILLPNVKHCVDCGEKLVGDFFIKQHDNLCPVHEEVETSEPVKARKKNE